MKYDLINCKLSLLVLELIKVSNIFTSNNDDNDVSLASLLNRF